MTFMALLIQINVTAAHNRRRGLMSRLVWCSFVTHDTGARRGLHQQLPEHELQSLISCSCTCTRQYVLVLLVTPFLFDLIAHFYACIVTSLRPITPALIDRPYHRQTAPDPRFKIPYIQYR